MATRIIECGAGARGDGLPIVPPVLVEQSAMTATGTSAQSSAFGDGTSLVIVQSDEAIYVKVGNNPTATTNSYKLAAGAEQAFTAGAGQKVAIRT